MIESSRSARIGVLSFKLLLGAFYQIYMTEDVMYARVYFGCLIDRTYTVGDQAFGRAVLYLYAVFALYERKNRIQIKEKATR